MFFYIDNIIRSFFSLRVDPVVFIDPAPDGGAGEVGHVLNLRLRQAYPHQVADVTYITYLKQRVNFAAKAIEIQPKRTNFINFG